jgi:hypothetical protein
MGKRLAVGRLPLANGDLGYSSTLTSEGQNRGFAHNLGGGAPPPHHSVFYELAPLVTPNPKNIRLATACLLAILTLLL